MSYLGRLAAVEPSVGVNTLIYTTPPGSSGISATVSICNRNATDAVIRLAFVDGVVADLVDADWIEYDVTIRAGGILERSDIRTTRGQSFVGYSNTANVNFQIWG